MKYFQTGRNKKQNALKRRNSKQKSPERYTEFYNKDVRTFFVLVQQETGNIVNLLQNNEKK